MLCRKVGLYGIGIIQEITFGIEERIRDPVVEVLKRFLIAPEQLKALRLSITVIAGGNIAVIDVGCFNEVVVLFIISLYAESGKAGGFLVLGNIMRGPAKG